MSMGKGFFAYYDILELKPSCDTETINKKYKRISLRHHPDKGGSSEMFCAINNAYKCLSDPKKKARYDKLGIDVDMDGTSFSQPVFDSVDFAEPMFSLMLRTALGWLFVYLIQYSLVLACLALAGSYALYKQPADKRWSYMYILFVCLFVSWLSQFQTWYGYMLVWLRETCVIFIIIFSAFDLQVTVWLGIKTCVSAFLAYWFGGRLFYYFMSIVLELVLLILAYMLVEVVSKLLEDLSEAKLELFAKKVRDSVAETVRENGELRRKVRSLEGEVNALKGRS